MSSIIAILHNNRYYYGELKNNTISNETNFNPFDFYFKTVLPSSFYINKSFIIHAKCWTTTTAIGIGESLMFGNNQIIPVVQISNPDILVYFNYIPQSLIQTTTNHQSALKLELCTQAVEL
jgi:hypothetical protein